MTMTHVDEHCKLPRWRRGRWRHTPWVCSCGRAWLSYTETYFSTLIPNSDPVVITRWRVWAPWEK